MKFSVIDTLTGKEADTEEIALKEEWADGLIWCDMEGFAIGEDGMLMLMDECGNMRYCPNNRFTVVFDLTKELPPALLESLSPQN